MELSPKQQSVEQIKKASRILIIGHKNPSGDFLGSALALQKALTEIGKSAEVAISDPVPDIFMFLPFIDQIKTDFSQNTGKILRINTNKVPVKSVKFQKDEGTLDFILEADKNLKFEFIEIINGEPKPDLIVVLNTSDVEKIDAIYDKNTELFFEVPVINIDHHAGNDYFGTVNLVDLTATSTAEILVSLMEALGIKIADVDSATLLLAGIIAETGSFRSQNTTPKSLTVAAQLLAAGGRQQEIVNNLYRKRPMALMKTWGEMLSDIKLDANHKFAWTKVKLDEDSSVTIEDVMDSADELLSNNPNTEMVLILVQKGKGTIAGKFKSRKGISVLELAQLFEGDGVPTNATFELSDMKLGDAELTVLKTLADYWGEETEGGKDLWDIVEGKTESGTAAEIEKEMTKTPELPKEQVAEIEAEMVETPEKKEDADVIEHALHSIEKEENKLGKTKKGPGNFSSVGEVLYKKTAKFDIPIKQDMAKPKAKEKEIDVFDEDDE
jgi:bifunctional oligoribonuclease and PAP phosphatase NrnA